MKSLEVPALPPSTLVPFCFLLFLAPRALGAPTVFCPETLLWCSETSAWAAVSSEHTGSSCFAELEMYLPESYVYKGIKIKSHRAAAHLSLEKHKSLRNSSGLGKAVTFSYHGNAHLPPFYAGPTLELASCRLEDSAVGQKDHRRGAGRPVVWSQLRC